MTCTAPSIQEIMRQSLTLQDAFALGLFVAWIVVPVAAYILIQTIEKSMEMTEP